MGLLWTNYDAGAVNHGGAFMDANPGSGNNAAPLATVKAVLTANAEASRWTEITADAPTPAFLRPYASAVIASPYLQVGQVQAQYYLNDDPGLLEATPYCRIMRIVVGRTSSSASYEASMSFEIMDTRFESTMWINPANVTTTGGSSNSIAASPNEDNWSEALRFYLWETSNALLICARNATEAFRGFGLLMYPDAPADGHAPRSDVSLLTVLQGSNLQVAAPGGTGYSAVSNAALSANETQSNFRVAFEGGGLKAGPDALGRDILQRPFLVRNLSPGCFAAGYDSDLRFTAPGVATPNLTKTIGGKEFAVAVATGQTILVNLEA